MTKSTIAIGLAIDALKDAHGVVSDRDLAAALDIDPSTISTWRRRASIPKRYLKGFKPSQKQTINSAELAIVELFFEIYEQLRGSIVVGNEALTRKHWAFRFCAFQLKISGHLIAIPEGQWSAAIDDVRKLAMSIGLAEFIERIEFIQLPHA